MTPRDPREPGWVAPLLERLLEADDARALRADLAEARPDGGGVRRHAWYARQLARADLLRLAWLLRARRGRAGAGARRAAGSGAGLGQDVRQGLRRLRRGGVFALLCLAVGIGLCGAAVGAVRSVFLAPLPFADGDRLAVLTRAAPEGGEGGPLTWLELDVARSDPAVEAAEAWSARSVTLQGADGAERVAAASVTPGLLPLLGVDPLLGRTFAPDEGAEPGFEEVAVLGHDLWMRRFGGDPGAVGRDVVVNERAVRVVGVLPPGVSFPSGQALWLPLGSRDPVDAGRRYLAVVARLAADAPVLAGGGSESGTFAARLGERLARRDPGQAAAAGGPAFRVESLRRAFIPDAARRFLPLTLAAVALVLLIACADVANLLLVRGLARRGEMALRVALGASPPRLARLVVVETATLAAGAGVLGALLARGWLALLERRLPPGLPYWTELRLDGVSLAVVLSLTLAATALAAIPPALRLARTVPGGRLPTGRVAGGHRLGRTLAAAEVALGFVLLGSAALLGRSLAALGAEDPGFDDRGVASLRVVLGGDAYDGVAARLAFVDDVRRGLASEPSVAAAAATTAIPGSDGGSTRRLGAGGVAEGGPSGALVGVSAGYFEVLGVQARSGRLPTAAEAGDTAAAVAVVDAGLAAALWPGGDAVGGTLAVEGEGVLTVVGVVDPIRYGPPGDPAAPTHQVHVPWARLPGRGVAFLARSPGTPPGEGALRRAVATADAGQAPYDVALLTERRALATAHRRLFATLAWELGAVAHLLALAGVYGVVAHEVAGRRRELGIRRALGAPRRAILAGVLAVGAGVGGVGVAVGFALVAAVGGLLRGLLYGVGPLDAVALGGAAAVLGATALVAALVPAARAVRADPGEVLDEA